MLCSANHPLVSKSQTKVLFQQPVGTVARSLLCRRFKMRHLTLNPRHSKDCRVSKWYLKHAFIGTNLVRGKAETCVYTFSFMVLQFVRRCNKPAHLEQWSNICSMSDLLEDLYTLLHQARYIVLVSSFEQLQNLQHGWRFSTDRQKMLKEMGHKCEQSITLKVLHLPALKLATVRTG